MQMANRYMKRYSTSLLEKSKSKLPGGTTSVRMAIIKKSTHRMKDPKKERKKKKGVIHSKSWRQCGEKGNTPSTGGM